MLTMDYIVVIGVALVAGLMSQSLHTVHAEGLAKRYLLDSTTQWMSWEQYAACETTCVSGYENRTRECCSSGNNLLCLQLPWTILKPLVGTCPVDGQWSTWTAWNHCSVTCGLGNASRTRTCVYDVTRPHGAVCPGSAQQTQECNLMSCPVDGLWATWSSWSACTKTCGAGTKFRARLCAFPPSQPQGDPCPGASIDRHACALSDCPVDGQWSMWTAWNHCSVTCGLGNASRTRTCVYDVTRPHGAVCPGSAQQTHECNQRSCPVDGIWLSWHGWSSCSVSCGDGTQRRVRECHFSAHVPQGDYCAGRGVETQNCSNAVHNHCPVDGTWEAWTAWTACSASCGGGTQIRRRDCYFQPHTIQGEYCAGTSRERKDCNTQQCPV